MNKPPQHRARKRFGQNFLHDQAIIQRICQQITPGLSTNQPLLEIGPGLGALTYALAQAGHPVYAVELDRDLIAHWQQQPADANIHIIEQDALTLDLTAFAAQHALPTPLTAVGNLPYNIATALISRLLAQANAVARMVFMVQKEVGLRLTAAAGDSEYSRLSVLVQNQADARYAFTVPPGAFSPPPKVESAIIELVVRPTPIVASEHQAQFEQLVTTAFKQRRKTLRNNLKPLLSATEIEQAGIDPGQRPQTLTIEQYQRLATLISNP